MDTKNPFLQHRAAFTLEYWVRPTGGRTADPSVWLNRIGIVGQNDAIEYGFIDPKTIQIWTPNGGALNTTYSFPDDEWHHVATIASGTSLKTYYDGKLAGTTSSTTGDYGSSVYNVHIGGGGVFDATGNWFIGNIDEVAIFDKAIPADRVAAHYTAGKSGGVLTTTGAATGGGPQALLIVGTASVPNLNPSDTGVKARLESLGLTPREHSSGSRRRLGTISKRGDTYLRMLLIHGARAVLWHAKRPTARPLDRLRTWALQLERLRGHNKAAVALANKLARIAWAVWKHGSAFTAVPTA